MVLRTDSHDSDLPMFAYLMVLATVAAVLAYSLYWLWRPHTSPNPGLAAYQAPTGLYMSRATPLGAGGLVAQLAAAEARAEVPESAPEPEPVKPKRTASSNARRAPQTTLPRVRDERRQAWARDSWGHDSWGRDSWGRDSWGRDSWGRDQWGRDQWGRDQRGGWDQRGRGQSGYRGNPYGAFGRGF
jgi:hypothetical protein